MAQIAKIAALTDELIQSVLQFDPDVNRAAFKHAKEIATRGLRAHHYARTNQFEVERTFDGLDEKFRILHRDDIGDALTVRIEEIRGHRSKWIPEYLSLLLHLSDKPTENEGIDALNLLRPPTPPAELTWAQILEDDPYSDEEIWDEIDYAADSTDEEQNLQIHRNPKPASSTPEEDREAFDLTRCTEPIDLELLAEFEKAQLSLSSSSTANAKVVLTELRAIREILYMLGGLDTSLFQLDKQKGTIQIDHDHNHVLSHAMPETTNNLLNRMANIGTEINHIRAWTRKGSTVALTQTFEAAVQCRLRDYDRQLAHWQSQYLDPPSSKIVSLLELHDVVRSESESLLELAKVIAEVEPQLLNNPFNHLEALHDRVTLAQLTLRPGAFTFFSKLFFDCLQMYLRPIERWMVSGELGANDETFFIFESDAGIEKSSLWHDRYRLRYGKKQTLRCPSFLQPASQKIFNTGKSAVVLKDLNMFYQNIITLPNEPRLDHDIVCGQVEDMPLLPFPELFQAAFDNWISSKYSYAAQRLQDHVVGDGGLLQAMNDLGIVYRGTDGSVFQAFADSIFQRMESNRKGWNDRFLLTELARSIFSAHVTQARADGLVVRVSQSKTESHSVKSLQNISLDFRLPWLVMNVIQRQSISIHQHIFTFLLQVYRAKYVLQRVSPKAIQSVTDVVSRQMSFKLRQRLLWYVDNLRSYMTETVIAPNTAEMILAIVSASNIDEMSAIHNKFAAKLQEQTLLSDNLRPIHKAMIEMLDLAVLFAMSLPINVNAAKRAKATGGRIIDTFSAKPSRRSSVIPGMDGAETSDTDSEENDNATSPMSHSASERIMASHLTVIERDFSRLLAFTTAGLRSVSRVGTESVWNILADRLQWGSR